MKKKKNTNVVKFEFERLEKDRWLFRALKPVVTYGSEHTNERMTLQTSRTKQSSLVLTCLCMNHPLF